MQESVENGSEVYLIRSLSRFDTSYKQLVKTHYQKSKKSKEDKQRLKKEFEDLVYDLIDKISEAPCSDQVSGREPFPNPKKNDNYSELVFRKVRFNAPGLEYAARYARLMYVVHHDSKTVFLMWIYTHAEFAKRPSDDDIRTSLKELIKKQSDRDS